MAHIKAMLTQAKPAKLLLPPKAGNKPCLVLDLDETLVHSSTEVGSCSSRDPAQRGILKLKSLFVDCR